MYLFVFISAQASQAHFTSVLCKRESVPRYNRLLRLCMRNKILRSARAKYPIADVVANMRTTAI